MPRMARWIPHSRPTLGGEEERAVLRVLRSGQPGGGPEVERFEREMERFLGGGHATAVQTGSAALHLALLAIGVRPGGRVVIPSYTCAAVMNAVRYAGAEPVLADADPATCNLDPADVRRRLRRGTQAIVVPHMFGRPAPVGDLRRLGVPVIEDCAMAVGGPVGREGEISVFSFYATKMMATGHGGMVVCRDARHHAAVRDLVEYDNREDYKVRFNYRMSGLAAALGRAQLARVPKFVKARRRIADYYYKAIRRGPPPPGHVFYRFVLVQVGLPSLIRYMARHGIECKRPVFRPLHRYFGPAAGDFPGAEELHRDCLSYPLYPSLRPSERNRVARALRARFP